MPSLSGGREPIESQRAPPSAKAARTLPFRGWGYIPVGIPAQCSREYTLGTVNILSRLSSVGCGDLWQGYISAPGLQGHDWSGVLTSQVRPNLLSYLALPRPLVKEVHQGSGLGLSHESHFTKWSTSLKSSNKYLLAKDLMMARGVGRCFKMLRDKGGRRVVTLSCNGRWGEAGDCGPVTPSSAQGKALAVSSAFLLDFLDSDNKDQHSDRQRPGLPVS